MYNLSLRQLIYDSAVCLAVIVMCVAAFAGSLRRMLAFDGKGYEQWVVSPIPELSRRGNEYISNPDSFPQAIQVFTAIVGRYEGEGASDRDIRQVVSAMNNLGYVYTFHYLDYQKGIKYLNQGLELAESRGIKDLIPVICLNLGAIYSLNHGYFSTSGFPERSMKVYSRGLEVAFEVKDWKNYLKLLNNVLNLHLQYPGSPLPKGGYMDIREVGKYAADDVMYPFTLLHVQACEAAAHGGYARADSLYSLMEKNTAGFQDEARYRLMAISEKARMKEEQRDFSSAINEITRTLQIADDNDCDDLSLVFYDDARRLYTLMGDRGQAERYYVLYLKQKDSIFNACRMMAVNEYQFQHEMDKIEHTVRDLSYRKKIQNVWLWVFGIFSALALLFALYYMYSNRRLRQRNKSLYRKNLVTIATQDRNFSLEKENDELRSELSSLRERSRESETHDRKGKYSYSMLDESRKEEIHKKMETVIEEDRDIFNQDFSLAMLAEKIGCPSTYLSQVIGEKTGKNFYVILSERRIKEACRIMSNPANCRLTIEGVALEVGIRSRSNFTSLFKKFTGLTPGEFARQTRELGHAAQAGE